MRLIPTAASMAASDSRVNPTIPRHARRLRPDTELRAWLYTVARNLARSQARFALADAAGVAALARWWYLDAPSVAPDEAAVAADTGARLAAALGRLSLAGREVLLLVAGEGLSVEAAAQVLSITPEAARQRLHHARARAAFERGERNPAAGIATFVAVTAAIVSYLGWAVAFLRALVPA